MSHSRKKLIPIGSNMNDAAYPFRGEYRLDDVINHGHSGVAKHARTSLALRVSGANLVIEQLQVPKDAQLNCELAVDGGIARAVSLGGAAGEAGAKPTALAVPGDGRDYQVTAVVKTPQGRHFCKMTFNGSEGQSTWRLRAPTQGPPDAVQLFVDGKRVRPVGGYFIVPLRAVDCALVLNLPDHNPRTDNRDPTGDDSGSSHKGFTGQQQSFLPQLSTPLPIKSGGILGTGAAPPETFTFETVRGTAPTAVLQCMASGQRFGLAENTAASVPSNVGPYRLHLPAGPTPSAPTEQPLAVPVGSTSASVPEQQPPSPPQQPVLEVESRPHMGPNGDHCYTVIVRGGVAGGGSTGPTPIYTVQLTADDGTVASGVGHATLTLPHKREQQVQIVVTDATQAVVLRQRQHIPSQQPPTVGLSVQEEPSTGALVVRGIDGSRVTVAALGTAAGATPSSAPGAASSVVRVDRSKGPQTVVVEQTNSDGSVTSATLNVEGKPSLGAPPPTSVPFAGLGVSSLPVPPATTAEVSAPGGASAEAALLGKWAEALAAALRAPSLEEAKRAVQEMQAPPTAPAATITHFVREQLHRPTPAFAFSTQPGGLTNVSCGGMDVKAAVGSEADTPVAPGGTVSIPDGSYATLTAFQPGTSRPVASLRVVNRAGGNTAMAGFPAPPAAPSLFGASSSPYAMSPPPTTGDTAEETMMARLVECLQRHNMDPAKVAEDLALLPPSSLSPGGRRLVPLLVNCLRRAVSDAAASAQSRLNPADASAGMDDILFTCGNGYIANIHTSQPHYQLTASVDGQAAAPLQQRGRLPTGLPDAKFSTVGQPHFVELVAKDPVTGQVKKRVRVTVMGYEDVAPVRYSASPAPPASASAAPQAHTGPLPSDSSSRLTPHPPPTWQESQPQGSATAQAGTTGAAVPEQPTLPGPHAAGKVPYLDLSLQQVGQDVQLRCTTRPAHRIVCNLDGLGGDTGLSDFTTRMHSARAHKVELSVLDPYGQIAFQQRLEVPATSSSVWGVAVQDGGLSLDPDGGCVATISADRTPERAVQGNYISLDTNTPHFLILRRYLNGVHGVKAGELALRLPAFISPADLEALERLYRSYLAGGLDDGGLRQELLMLRNRCTSPVVRELIDTLVEVLKRRRGESGGAMVPLGGQSSETVPSSSGRVYFRLTGRE